jgi:hypothetical protein
MGKYHQRSRLKAISSEAKMTSCPGFSLGNLEAKQRRIWP